MAEEPKVDPVAGSEPKLAKTETELATNPQHGESAKEESKDETPATGVCETLYRALMSQLLLAESLLTIPDLYQTGNKRSFYCRLDCYFCCQWGR